MSSGSLKTDFYTTLVSGVFFPLHELIKKHDTVAIRKEMEVSQWWDEDRLEQLRVSRLRRLLASAEARVPYYRNLFADIGFKVEEVASLADLAKLPLLDKSAIRANSDALKAETLPTLRASIRGDQAANR
jgi:phenylacetate-CoA ligase